MNWTTDPPRLRSSSDVSGGLVAALDAARGELPEAWQVQRLASGLKPLVGAAVLGAGLTASASLGRSFAWSGLLSLKSPLVTFLAGMAVGATVWHLGDMGVRSARDAAQVVAVSTDPAPRAAIAAPASPLVPLAASPSFGEAPPSPAGAVTGDRGRALPPIAGASPSDRGLPVRDFVSDSTEPATGPGTMGESESALLGRAQSALASDPRTALALSERHARLFPTGLLAQERELIAVQALLGLGDKPAAAARAAQFRAQFAGSAHLRRLDHLLGRDDSGEGVVR